MKRPPKPHLTLLLPDNLDGIEAFILKVTGEPLTPENREKLLQAAREDQLEADDFASPGPDEFSDTVRDHGELVACQDWDSGGPGGGAGRVSVYRYHDEFYAFNDSGGGGPFASFDEAAEWSGVLRENDATVAIWVGRVI